MSQQQAGPKRFIAGAVCPRCGVQDRIRLYSFEGATHRDCVACGFEDLLEEAAADFLPEGRLPEGRLPEGRLDGARKPAPAQGQPLQFHPPKARRKKAGDDDAGGT